jgi:hypothetical protein
MTQPEREVTSAPSYLAGVVVAATDEGPAHLLDDGEWCGHGEPKYRVFAVPGSTWQVEVPIGPGADPDDEGEDAPIVRLHDNAREVVVYDSRKHPASVFAGTSASARTEPHLCSCGADRFRVAVGFEVPFDSDGVDDTTWFALAVQCAACGEMTLAYDDETA